MSEVAYPQHERRILYHLLHRHTDAALIEEKLRPEVFTDETCRWAFQLLVYWRHVVGHSLTLDSVIEEVGRRVTDQGLRTRIADLFLRLSDFDGSSRADMEHSVFVLDREWRTKSVLSLTTRMVEKLSRDPEIGITEELQALFDVQNPDDRGTFRNTRNSAEFYAAQYEEAKRADETSGYSTGFSRIDQLTGGLRRGKLWVVTAYVGDGKTSLAWEMTYNVAKAGGRVLFVSLEMDEDEIMRGFYARRSHDISKQVGQGVKALAVRDIAEAKLTAIEEKLYAVARKDLESWDISIWCPGDCTVADIRRRVMVEQLVKPLDLVVIDYLTLCKTTGNWRAQHESMGEMVREAKRLARRESVPVLALHQISRDGYKSALERGYYVNTDLAQTAEVERNADVVLWSLIPPDLRAANEGRIGLSKNRGGPLMVEGYHIFTDFAHALMTERVEGTRDPDYFKRFFS